MTENSTQHAAAIALDWWQRLASKEGVQLGQRRAALARLRRAATPLEVMQEPEALRLIVRLPRNPDRVAVLAGVLAFVREDDNERIAYAVGPRSLQDEDRTKAIMSEGRLRRLLQTQGDELMEPMRRVVRMTKGKANVSDLSHTILYWSEGMKKRWMFEYYGAGDSLSSEERAFVPPVST